MGVAPRGPRTHRLVRSLEAHHASVHQSTVRLRADRRHLERDRSGTRLCTRPGALDDLRNPPSAPRAPCDAKLDMSAALARPTSPMGTQLSLVELRAPVMGVIANGFADRRD